MHRTFPPGLIMSPARFISIWSTVQRIHEAGGPQITFSTKKRRFFLWRWKHPRKSAGISLKTSEIERSQVFTSKLSRRRRFSLVKCPVLPLLNFRMSAKCARLGVTMFSRFGKILIGPTTPISVPILAVKLLVFHAF